MADLVRHESSNDVLTVYSGGRVNLAGGQLQAAGVNLIPPPGGTPDGDVLTARASAPGGANWEPGVGGVSSPFTIGALATVNSFILNDGDSYQLSVVDGPGWQSGLTTNGTNNGLIVTVKGRYAISAELYIGQDAVNSLHWTLDDSQSIVDGIGAFVASGNSGMNQSYFYTGYAELDVGAEIDWLMSVYGGNAAFVHCYLMVQYVGPATSI